MADDPLTNILEQMSAITCITVACSHSEYRELTEVRLYQRQVVILTGRPGAHVGQDAIRGSGYGIDYAQCAAFTRLPQVIESKDPGAEVLHQ